ncbi:hypothetical protein [[Mycobacterium] zoologicum]|uniref:hypothetical protein n=1 Tax=[Mycobacterium] zoologicum TaxID=2872311 RepID=UPI001CDA7A96|nr:hypothetical protein [Mycolicibacter sp. MYC101]MEB3064522.1 hypothetical protein [Mycolicibacter sp. MYC101]
MTSGFIIATLAIIVYSLWVRRDTWWTRWEVTATCAVAMEGCALLLMSPWAAPTVGVMLHQALGVWNVQQMLGHLCLIAAVSGNIYHMLVRLADPEQVKVLMRRQLMVPIWLGVAIMVPAFVLADQDYLPDFFSAPSANSLMIVYAVTGSAVVLYLSTYVSRLMLTLRQDPRAKTTIDLYLVSMGFAAAATTTVVASAWVEGDDAGPVIWACVCLSIGIFSYGSARSWRAKSAWFSPATAR